MKLVIRLLILMVAIYVASYILPGVKIDSPQTFFVLAISLAFVNAFVKPVLVFLTFPLTIVTLGIFLLILNGLLIILVSMIVPGFHVTGLITAILFGIIVSLVSSLLNNLGD